MKKIHLIIGIFLISLVSCEITDDNIDPNNPNENIVPVGLTYPGMVTQTHRNLVAINARIAGIVSQHYDGIDAQQIAYSQYNITESDIDDTWDFGLYGAGAMTDCFTIIKNGDSDKAALAKLYMAVNLGVATNMWGDIPYTEAFNADNDGNFTPVYDSQSDVYETIQQLLTESINEGVSGGFGEFRATSSNWEGVAHALKARYYMQLSRRDPAAAASALSEAQMAIGSVTEQPDFVYQAPNQNSNPLYLFEQDRPGTLAVHPNFDAMLAGDPRQSLYTNGSLNFVDSGLFWGELDSPTPLISYWEVKFIEAEAIIRTNGTDADALTALQDAVVANMEYVGVSNADATTYANALALSGTMEDKIEVIITEKYKAAFGNAPIEAWNDFRRTGYPQLTPDPDAVSSQNPSLVVPRRFLYPITERQNNEQNYSAAISAQGGHLLDVDLWAFMP